MKTLILLFLMVCIGQSASAIGHPHNLFSAHRKVKQYVPKTKDSQRTPCQLSQPTLVKFVRTLAQ
ncbi:MULTISPECIES: hypothetical protein [Larkinella]|jgi:hypothetical protein|uniref:Uncharacterized protein n=1 Tax=Larkinella punicea TaxID=2315727 RepID=A0A368JVM0_9BACT|nr:hypothetical protein [Larkinella punicea]RCR71405.1 hypothetical protein DUE52_00255 [Larkinella punicea]